MTECRHGTPLKKQGAPGKDGPSYSWVCLQCGTRWQRGWTMSQVAEMEANLVNTEVSIVQSIMKETRLDLYTEKDVKLVRGLVHCQVIMGTKSPKNHNPTNPLEKSETQTNTSTSGRSGSTYPVGANEATSSTDIRETPNTVMKKRVVAVGQEDSSQTGMTQEVQLCENYYQNLLKKGMTSQDAALQIMSESHGTDVTVMTEWLRLKKNEAKTGKSP